jgi:hypothetical protein
MNDYWDRQIAELKRKEEQKKQGKTKKKTLGRCSCGCARFQHKMRDRQLIRICHDCKAEKIF